MWSRNSRRIVPITRSVKAFCQGERGAENLGDSHALHPSPKLGPVDAVAITEEEARR
jgi:hypothetical protein